MITTLSTEQTAALEAIQGWHRDAIRGRAKQVFRLFGPAGTGKTTIARHVPEMLRKGWEQSSFGDPDILYAAYTGKAAHVLRKKGCDGAGTIHSLIYTPTKINHSDVIDELRRMVACGEAEPKDRRKLAELEKEHGKLVFRINDGSPLAGAWLLIVDEVSMVGYGLAQDLLSFGVPILVLGDPEQLPPIHGEGFLTEGHEPDVLLQEIHRQALDSPVLQLAHRVRTSNRRDKGVTDYDAPAIAELAAYDQVLCGMNKTRWHLIQMIRDHLGLPRGVPSPGDRIICLNNNKALGCFNGQQYVVIASLNPTVIDTYELLLLDPDTNQSQQFTVYASGFKSMDSRDNGSTGLIAKMTFAQAVTVHKAQGSEWGNVLVVDESGKHEWLAKKDGKSEADAQRHGRRWLYTAITRAAQSVTLAKASSYL